MKRSVSRWRHPSSSKHYLCVGWLVVAALAGTACGGGGDVSLVNEPLASDPATAIADGNDPVRNAEGSNATVDLDALDVNVSTLPAATDPTGVGSVEPVVTGDPALTAKYVRCIQALGLEFDGVEVFVSAAGTPQFVKSGIDVPADVHVPCFRSIGGTAEAGESSWGPLLPWDSPRP